MAKGNPPHKRITKQILIISGFAFLITAAAFGLNVLTQDKNELEIDGKPNVIATFFPLYDFTREIAGDRINLDIIFTQTPEVSSFSPNDIEKINKAHLVIKNGIGLEPILDELILASDNKDVTVADTSEGVIFAKNPGDIETHEDEDRHQDHGLADPHIWLNPQNAIIQVKNIRDALIQLDPENAQFYRENSETYISKLIELDQRLYIEISALSEKDFIAFHSAFGYFAQRYGLNQVAVIEEFPGKEPSPKYISDVIRTIKETGAKVIFSEPQFSPRIADALAKDLNLTVYPLNPVETGDISRDSYVKIMEDNLLTLKNALR